MSITKIESKIQKMQPENKPLEGKFPMLKELESGPFEWGIINCYWLSQAVAGGKVEQSLLGQILGEALVRGYNLGLFKKFGLNTSYVWGKGEPNNPLPSVAETMRKFLMERGIKNEDVTILPPAYQAFDSVKETVYGIEYFQNTKPGKAIQICGTEAHRKSIAIIRKLIFPELENEITLVSAEKMIRNYGWPEGRALLKKRKLIHRFNHSVYEKAKELALKSGKIKPEDFSGLAEKQRTGPSDNFILTTDAYKLPNDI